MAVQPKSTMMGVVQIYILGVNRITSELVSENEGTYRLRLFDISLVSPEAKDSSDHATHRGENGNNTRCF